MVNVEYANNNLNLGKKKGSCHIWSGSNGMAFVCTTTYCICGPETEHVPLHLLQP